MKVRIAAVLWLAGCSSNLGPTDMGGGCVMIGGQCLYPPTQPAARTACGNITEYCDPRAQPKPNLTCLGTTPMPAPGPATVTMTGFVHVFSNGPNSQNVSIAVYDAAALRAAGNPTSVTPIAQVAASAL